MRRNRHEIKHPFFSICIPQYDRTSFLLEALKVLESQSLKNFEICISDDLSPDCRQKEIVQWLEKSGMDYSYRVNANNLRYDGNLRSCIELARGRYCFLHGNDDCLSRPEALQELYDLIVAHGFPEAIITNFEDWESGEVTRRVHSTGIAGTGPEGAVSHYRNVAFVTGVLLDREKAQLNAGELWDGSEMYQMWLFCRILGNKGKVLTDEDSLVRKDIRVPGEEVDSYAKITKLDPCPIITRTKPFCQIGRLVKDGIEPYVSPERRGMLFEKIFRQLYLFTYPFWLFEYRRVQSWKYAVGIALGIRPSIVIGETSLPLWRRGRLNILYFSVCLVGLLMPISLFDWLRPQLYKIAKTRRLEAQGQRF
jgi:glycosyltransferase involved in cell wall biosynthesis